MPTVLLVTELQRNIALLADKVMRAKGPIYLTRRGKAAVVLLDAADYGCEMSHRRASSSVRSASMRASFVGMPSLRGGSVTLGETLSEFTDKWSLRSRLGGMTDGNTMMFFSRGLLGKNSAYRRDPVRKFS